MKLINCKRPNDLFGDNRLSFSTVLTVSRNEKCSILMFRKNNEVIYCLDEVIFPILTEYIKP